MLFYLSCVWLCECARDVMCVCQSEQGNGGADFVIHAWSWVPDLPHETKCGLAMIQFAHTSMWPIHARNCYSCLFPLCTCKLIILQSLHCDLSCFETCLLHMTDSLCVRMRVCVCGGVRCISDVMSTSASASVAPSVSVSLCVCTSLLEPPSSPFIFRLLLVCVCETSAPLHAAVTARHFPSVNLVCVCVCVCVWERERERHYQWAKRDGQMQTHCANNMRMYTWHQEITLVYICRIRMRIYVIKSLNDIYMSNNF